MRLLGAVRLSNLTDETTSLARQREQITYTAKARGDVLIALTEDADTSGAVSPFEREQVGPWLTDPDKIREWDGLIVAKLDRLTRSLRDFDDLRQWCDANGKTLISVAESLDLTTSTGRMFANLLAMFAQFERERMGERRREAAVTIRAAAHWGGHKVPFGYRPVKVNSHWELEPDPEHARTIELVADQVIEGRSVTSLAAELNRRNVPTAADAERIRRGRESQGGQWGPHVLMHVLRSPVLKGYILEYPDGRNKPGRALLGPDGRPVRRAGILTDEKWQRLQDALGKSKPQSRRHDRAPLTGAAFCALCGSALHAHRQRPPGRTYYLCTGRRFGCKARGIRMDVLEPITDEAFAAEFGDKPMMDKEWHAGDDHSVAKADIGRQIAELNEERFVRQVKRPDFAAILAKLTASYEELDAMPSEPGWWEPVDTGKTLGDHWAGLDMHGKGKLLRDIGLKVLAARTAAEPCVIEWATAGGETDEGVFVAYPRPWALESSQEQSR